MHVGGCVCDACGCVMRVGVCACVRVCVLSQRKREPGLSSLTYGTVTHSFLTTD